MREEWEPNSDYEWNLTTSVTDSGVRSSIILSQIAVNRRSSSRLSLDCAIKGSPPFCLRVALPNREDR